MPSSHAAEAARSFLDKTGLEPTLNRILVLSVLTGSGHALTARDVYEAVSRTHRLNRVTVYRILDLLTEKGVVNRVSFGEGACHFCVGDHHSHFHCTGCDQVLCLEDTSFQFDEHAVSRDLRLEVNNVDLHLEGLCEKCRQGRESAE